MAMRGQTKANKYDVVFEEIADSDFVENDLQNLGNRIIWGQESLFDKIGTSQKSQLCEFAKSSKHPT